MALKLDLRIDWSEMDLFGHVNNLAFMKYVQAARVNYWERIGLTQMYAQEKRGPMLASASCTFLKPLFYPGQVSIQTKIEFIKTTSFGLHHQLFSQNGALVAEAHDVVVMFDFNAGAKMPIPETTRDAISRI